MKKSNAASGIILSLTGGIFWGFSGSCGQYLFTYHAVSSEWLVPIRMIATGIILLSVCAVKNKSKIFDVWKGRSNALRMAAFTVFGLILCQYAYFTAIEHSNAGTATVLQYLSPAMILIFMCLKNKKAPAIAEVIAIFLAVGGTFLIATGGNLSSFSITPAALIRGLLAAVFLVCYSLIPGRLLEISDTPTVLGWGMLTGGIVISFIFRPWEIMPVISLPLIGAVAGIVILGTVLAYSFYLEGIRLIGATKASIISSIEPVAATVISAVWLGTEFTFTDIIGFVMIISTVFIISLFNAKNDYDKRTD
ncbi:MAG: EamA family transporter [Clostridia bacterium]|nr:EamA family transporter [Clostridia bacterium]